MFAAVDAVNEALERDHYLGRARRGLAWVDSFGSLVLDACSSRRLPGNWLELSRWCLSGAPNAGSQQWAAVSRQIRESMPEITTIISYSDPSVGHTGALYRACNWLWAPTWHRLRPPPSGNGQRKNKAVQSVKDRWIFPLQKDESRETFLSLNDDPLRRRYPWAEYREPRFRRNVPVGGTGGGGYQRWIAHETRLRRTRLAGRAAKV